MAERKIFAGPRLRRMRNALGLTQTAMAAGLGISPSYLNLIERNQRPLTVQIILKLAATYDLDVQDLQGEGAGAVRALKAVFADPLLRGELPGDQELVEVADAAPNVASGIVKLYRAYREQAERLSDLSTMLAREGRGMALAETRLPVDEVREAFETRPHHFARIEAAAEAFSATLDPALDREAALKDWLRRTHGIAVRLLPVHVMPDLSRRYDRHSMRLFLSERLAAADRLREVAQEVALLALSDAISAELAELPLTTDEARRIARFELARYAAHALLMPYAAFLQAAVRARYDLDVLGARFQVSWEQAAHRLTTLARSGAAGIAFFLMEVDQAGNRLRRRGANGFPQAVFGGGCPKLNVHAAFAEPGRILVEAVEMPEGARFLTVSRALEAWRAGFGERRRRAALMLGCDLSAAEDVIYADGLPARLPPVPVGPSCRLCERSGCPARAEPPLTRPLGLDEMVTGLSAFDFR
ncbi:MAG: helix-turn-helix domain-containing protein [Pararhizobium sp.]